MVHLILPLIRPVESYPTQVALIFPSILFYFHQNQDMLRCYPSSSFCCGASENNLSQICFSNAELTHDIKTYHLPESKKTSLEIRFIEGKINGQKL